MTRVVPLLLIFFALTGCAHFAFPGRSTEERAELWAEAQAALAQSDFTQAETLFSGLAERYPGRIEGRESLFYMGAIRLDPRNPQWDPHLAEEHLAEYLAQSGPDRARIYRYPEAQVLYEIARQLNLPPESRVAGLQPEERVVRVRERVVVPGAESRELAAEVERLQGQLRQREERIREQQEELERIRRTLTAPATSRP